MTCEEGPETVFSMFYPTHLLSFIIFTSKPSPLALSRADVDDDEEGDLEFSRTALASRFES